MESARRFEQLSDIMAFRVIVDTAEDCYRALGVIHRTWQMVPGRFKDLHLDAQAQRLSLAPHHGDRAENRRGSKCRSAPARCTSSAEFGLAAHWAYKQGERTPTGSSTAGCATWSRFSKHADDAEELLEHTRLAMYQDQIFAFTPKGALHPLPKGATPVDFAYAVHTDLGDQTVGAKINGRHMPLRTPLQNGDQVEIITSKRPSPEWEGWSSPARRGRRSAGICGCASATSMLPTAATCWARPPARSRSRLPKSSSSALSMPCITNRSRICWQPSATASLARAWCWRPSIPNSSTKEPRKDEIDTRVVSLRRPTPPPPAPNAPLLGLPAGVAFQFARCCRPVPGDAIAGLIRTGRPVSVHRAECAVLTRTQAPQHRLLDLGWNDSQILPKVAARLSVMTMNRPGSLGSISTVVGKQEPNIVDLKIGRRTPELYELLLDVEVDGLEQLVKVQAALRATACVTSVERNLG